ncbi:DUF6455 family protein [Marivita sp.]|jgi:hypothetical protein|uniref:DUF6455 family protein n=1 Tax=Marivita sp. TaxID=2003365 RepID=UPI003F6BB522
MKTQHRGDPGLHFWLTRSVAKVMGVSLSEEMAHDRLTAQGYAAMVTACRECALVASCQGWLGDQKGFAKTPPPGCVNGDIMQNLARHH